MKKLNFFPFSFCVVFMLLFVANFDILAQIKVIDASKVPEPVFNDAKKKIPNKKASKWTEEQVGNGIGSLSTYTAEYANSGKISAKYVLVAGSYGSKITYYEAQDIKTVFAGIKKLDLLFGQNYTPKELNVMQTLSHISQDEPTFELVASSAGSKGKNNIKFDGNAVSCSNCELTIFDNADLSALGDVFMTRQNKGGEKTTTTLSLAQQISKLREIVKKRGWKSAKIEINERNTVSISSIIEAKTNAQVGKMSISVSENKNNEFSFEIIEKGKGEQFEYF